MEYPRITLRRGKEQSLERFHPWVFSGAVADTPDTIEEGDIVAVYTSDGRMIGVGHYQIGSITVRILAWGDKAIDEAFFSDRLNEAFRMRQALGLIRDDNNAYRLVHGEGDFLPGLIVDIYGDTAVLQAHSPGMHFMRDTIARALTALPEAGIANVYYKSETTLPYKAHLDPQNEYIIGAFSTNVAIENGLHFNIDWLKGQKTGFFVDQRDNRALLEKIRQRSSRTQHVLLHRRILGICNARRRHDGPLRRQLGQGSDPHRSKRRAQLPRRQPPQGYSPGRVQLSCRDGAWRLRSHHSRPPAFAKHRSALKNALTGYRRLNAAAFSKIAPGGILFTFSCSQAVSREQFRLAVFSAAAQSGRKVRILHQLTQPADHPVNIYHPEGEYLKGLILYVE